MLCRLMSLLVYKYGLYPAFEKAGISPDFVLKKCRRREGFDTSLNASKIVRSSPFDIGYCIFYMAFDQEKFGGEDAAV